MPLTRGTSVDIHHHHNGLQGISVLFCCRQIMSESSSFSWNALHCLCISQGRNASYICNDNLKFNCNRIGAGYPLNSSGFCGGKRLRLEEWCSLRISSFFGNCSYTIYRFICQPSAYRLPTFSIPCSPVLNVGQPPSPWANLFRHFVSWQSLRGLLKLFQWTRNILWLKYAESSISIWINNVFSVVACITHWH